MKLASRTSHTDIPVDLTWRLLGLTFWLSAGTALFYAVVNYRQGQAILAMLDGASLAALVLGYSVALRLGRPGTGIQAIAVISWLTLATTITMQGGLRSPAIAWIVVLAPLLMLAGLKLGLALTALTVALIAALSVFEASDWLPPYREVPLAQRAVSAILITCLFAFAAWSALRWRTSMAGVLRAARDDAIEANRIKDRFIANLNHEIRTPMNALVAGAQLLDRRLMGSEQRALVDAVQLSANHLLALVNDVLDYARLEAGELHLDAIEFSLRGLTTSAIGMFATQAKAKQLSLSQDFAEGLPDGWIGDPVRLRQVLCNLLSNAIKFTEPHGRVMLRVTSAATLEGGSVMRFEVSDSGPGISADAQLRLFRPYGQGDSSIASRFGGTGLGLAICKELLRLMKGSIEVRSQLGAGATFCVALPLTPADPGGPQLTSTDPIAQLNLPADLKVMLVEDDLVNQMSWNRCFVTWARMSSPRTAASKR